MQIRRVVLEMTLKPFYLVDGLDLDAVSQTALRQWQSLTTEADQLAVLLWVADGSEILEYTGTLSQPLEWARYIGGANPKRNVPRDSQGRALHSRCYPYRENAPELVYRDLAAVVGSIKQVGREIFGRAIEVGATFDPGPEFAKSPFKYERHPESCLAASMGDGQHRFATCYAQLHADDHPYVGFPDGIVEGTSLGTFLGRQSRIFMGDLGFDYLWLSNGFGLGTETWAVSGTLFDGRSFNPAERQDLAERVVGFWRDFRAECQAPIETRGTNLSLGVDWASDASPMKALYEGGFDFTCPPNSPWAALNGDFGLELTGYMSRIARLPTDQQHYPFRFYTHDPWWMNSPWLDRYGREPHDIYLPMSVSRLTNDGGVQTPADIELLTIDDSRGRMPNVVPNEVTPHLLRAWEDRPDAAGPVVWLYPFDTLDAMTFENPARLDEVFFHDQLLRGAINEGLPVNTVADAAVALPWLVDPDQGPLAGRVLLSRVPDAGDPLFAALLRWVQRGGRALLYGPTQHAAPQLTEALRLSHADPIEGDFTLETHTNSSELHNGHNAPTQFTHRALTSAGGCTEVMADNGDLHNTALTVATCGDAHRVVALHRSLGDGRAAWVRGSISYDFSVGGIGIPDDPREHFPPETLLRRAVGYLGVDIAMAKRSPEQRSAMTCIARHANAWMFSGYTPDTTVEVRYRLPAGAPLMIGVEAELIAGRAAYRLPRAWHHESRVFVEQDSGVVSCRERFSGAIDVQRRLWIDGLDGATVRFYPEPGTAERVQMLCNPMAPYYEGDFITATRHAQLDGEYLEASEVTGPLLISW